MFQKLINYLLRFPGKHAPLGKLVSPSPVNDKQQKPFYADGSVYIRYFYSDRLLILIITGMKGLL